MPWDNYQYTEAKYSRKPGVYRCLILAAEQTTSKSSGLPMLKLVLRPSGTSANVNAYIVGNDYFDENYSRFLDAFPEIKEQGLTKDNCSAFRGAVGTVKLILDENGFFKTHMYPWVKPSAELPPFKWYGRDEDPAEAPKFLSSDLEAYGDDAGGELPF